MEKYNNLEEFLEENYDWNEESLLYAQELLKNNDKESLNKVVTELEASFSWSYYDYRSVYELVKEINEEIAAKIAIENDFSLSSKEVEEAINLNKDISEFRISNTYIREKIEEKYITDDALFQSKYGGLSGQDAIFTISKVSKELGKKIYNTYEKEILKRFSFSGIDESSKINKIIALGVLDEKNLKRAVKRILKNSKNSLPISEIYKYNVFENEEIIEFAKEKSFSNTLNEKELPKFLVDYILESPQSECEYYIIKGFENKSYDNEQRLKAISILGFEYLANSFKFLNNEEKKYFFKLIKEDKEKYSFNDDELLKIYSEDEILGMELINISIEKRSNLAYILDYNFISGDQIFGIFNHSPERFAEAIASSSEKLKKLKDSGKDKEFAKKALSSVKKKNIKKLSEYLIDYIPEKDRLAIDLESIKSVDGAVNYIVNKHSNEKVRVKAISKIASSENALISICIRKKSEDLLSQEEYEKILTYKKGKEIVFSSGSLMNVFLENISLEELIKYFNRNSILTWTEENISKIPEDKLYFTTIDFLKEQGLSYSSKKIINHNNLNIIKAIAVSMQGNRELKEFVLEEGSSKAADYFLEKYNKIESKYKFIFDEELKNEEKSFSYFKKYISSKDEKYFIQIDKNLSKFINKWDKNKEEVVSMIVDRYSHRIILSFILKSKESRNLFFSKFIKKIEGNLSNFINKTSFYDLKNLEDEELGKLVEMVNSDPKALEIALADYNWQDLIMENVSIDKIVPKIISGELKPSSLPKEITNILLSQAVRQRDNFLLNLCFRNSSLEEFNEHVDNKEEALAIYEVIISNNSGSNRRSIYSYRSTYSYNNRTLESFFNVFERFNFSEEVSEYIVTVAGNTSNQERKASELLSVFGTKIKEDYIDKILEKTEYTGIKAELKRVVEWCLSSSYENYVLARIIKSPDLYESIVSKKLIKETYNESTLREVLNSNPTKSIILLVFSKENMSEELKDLALEKIIELDILRLKYEDGVFEGYLSSGYSVTKRLFVYNSLADEFSYNISSKESEKNIRVYLKDYLTMTDIKGKLNFKEKTIVQKNGEIFNLKDKEIGFITDNPNYMHQISGLYNFGVNIELDVKIVLDKYAKAQCFIYNSDILNKEKKSSSSVKKIEATILRKQEEIESDFSKILGTLSDESPFGIEMEFGSNMKRKTLAKKINEQIDDFNIEGTDRYSSINHNDWEIKYDSSIIGKFSAEIVSPKLYGEEGLSELYNVIEAVSNINTRGQIKTGIDYDCGIHVHHDINDLLKAKVDMDDLSTALYAIQEPLYSLCDKSRSTNTFCSKIYFNDMKVQNSFRGGFNTSTGYGTLEFRMKEGSMNSKEIINWVRVTKKAVEDTRILFKQGLLGDKEKIKESYNDLLDAIVLEKSRQLKEKSSENNHLEDSYDSFVFNDLLLGK